MKVGTFSFCVWLLFWPIPIMKFLCSYYLLELVYVLYIASCPDVYNLSTIYIYSQTCMNIANICGTFDWIRFEMEFSFLGFKTTAGSSNYGRTLYVCLMIYQFCLLKIYDQDDFRNFLDAFVSELLSWYTTPKKTYTLYYCYLYC